MGNNHDQYFGKQKRKILVLGLPSSGKTTFVNALTTNKINKKTNPTKDLNILDGKIGKLTVTFFDLAGGQRQRIFWKQHYEGTQGLVFIIDATSPKSDIEISKSQIDKIIKVDSLKQIPYLFLISKAEVAKQNDLEYIERMFADYKKLRNSRVFKISYDNIQSMRTAATWLINQTKPL